MVQSISPRVAYAGDDPFGSTLVLQGPSVAPARSHVTSDAVQAPMPAKPVFDYDIIEAAFCIGALDLQLPDAMSKVAAPEASYSTRRAIDLLFGAN